MIKISLVQKSVIIIKILNKYVDYNLVDVIDNAVEKTDNYEERIKKQELNQKIIYAKI